MERNREIDEIVHETVSDLTPRLAALALLRFPEYLELIQKGGVEATEEPQSALLRELRAVCIRETAVRQGK